MAFISEAAVEAMLRNELEGLGYTRLAGSISGPDKSVPGSAAYSDVVLLRRVEQAENRLNPRISPEACHDAPKKVIAVEKPAPITENCRQYRYLIHYVPITAHAAVDLTPEIAAFCLKQMESLGEHIRNNISEFCALAQTRGLLLPMLISGELQPNDLSRPTEAAK